MVDRAAARDHAIAAAPEGGGNGDFSNVRDLVAQDDFVAIVRAAVSRGDILQLQRIFAAAHELAGDFRFNRFPDKLAASLDPRENVVEHFLASVIANPGARGAEGGGAIRRLDFEREQSSVLHLETESIDVA